MSVHLLRRERHSVGLDPGDPVEKAGLVGAAALRTAAVPNACEDMLFGWALRRHAGRVGEGTRSHVVVAGADGGPPRCTTALPSGWQRLVRVWRCIWPSSYASALAHRAQLGPTACGDALVEAVRRDGLPDLAHGDARRRVIALRRRLRQHCRPCLAHRAPPLAKWCSCCVVLARAGQR